MISSDRISSLASVPHCTDIALLPDLLVIGLPLVVLCPKAGAHVSHS